VRKGISITGGQIELFALAVKQLYRLDDATVNHAMRVYENQREDQALFRNQAGRWAGEVVTTEEKAALATYVAALNKLDQLTGDVLAMCSTLSGQTIEKLLVKSDLEVGLEALGIPRD
jgi:16S rRNA U1498 N3-methylase RsmE